MYGNLLIKIKSMIQGNLLANEDGYFTDERLIWVVSIALIIIEIIQYLTREKLSFVIIIAIIITTFIFVYIFPELIKRRQVK